MTKLTDLLKYEWTKLKDDFPRFLFGMRMIKYLLIIMMVFAILVKSKIAMIYISVIILIYIFIDAYNNKEFLMWRSHQYKGTSKEMRRWSRKKLGDAGKKNAEPIDMDNVHNRGDMPIMR